MNTRRRIEETDESGRRRIMILDEEPEEVTGSEFDREEELREAQADSWVIARDWVRVLAALVALVFAVLEVLLTFRFAFLLGGANAANGFVDFVYDATDGLVAPFEGIFATRSVDGGVLEPASVIAVVVYALVAALIMLMLFTVASAPSPHGERSVATRSRRRVRMSRSE